MHTIRCALRRLIVPLLIATVLLTMPTLATPSPAADLDVSYLALGDSIPSGTDLKAGSGYPRLVGQMLADASGLPVRLDLRARPGERSDGVLANQLGDLGTASPRLITLTVGANDFLIPAIQCAAATIDSSPDTRCQLSTLLETVPAFESNYRAILRRLIAETDATVAVTTYYNPFPRGSRCAPGIADASVRMLNQTIDDIAAEAPDRVVVVDLAPLFKGHEGEAPSGWFSPNPLRLACTDIHPNAAGHEAIAEAIWSSLGPRLALADR
jgi:lysophospholipase L1-like esterase